VLLVDTEQKPTRRVLNVKLEQNYPTTAQMQ
jgi:hypothetical protein